MIGIIIFNHNMQNRQKLTHLERENGLKPHFDPFLALIGPFRFDLYCNGSIGIFRTRRVLINPAPSVSQSVRQSLSNKSSHTSHTSDLKNILFLVKRVCSSSQKYPFRESL